MFRRPQPDEVEDRPVFTRMERVGGAVAHAAPLLFGVPMFPLLGNVGFALLPSPIIAYIISRAFRNQQSEWGAFQGMQATIVHLVLVVLVFVAYFTGAGVEAGAVPSQVTLVAFVLAFLLFLYTLWGAWDTAWGYDFRYIFISNFVDRITSANLARQELRRRRREARRNNDPPSQPPSTTSS
ncbi:MAG: hypothetical protein OXR67_05425 [Chloroflexota bacterium]|nr:hypothetical protein [Chloroflexota bacterium]